MKIFSSIVSLVVFMVIFSSCKKTPGDGGLATIHGRVYGYNINNFGIVTDSGYIADTRVFISYGNHTWADGDTRTSYTGEYVFPYLQTGSYSVWVINECATCPLRQSYDLQNVTISKPRETVEVPDLKNYF